MEHEDRNGAFGYIYYSFTGYGMGLRLHHEVSLDADDLLLYIAYCVFR